MTPSFKLGAAGHLKNLELKFLGNMIFGEKLNFNRRCVSTNSMVNVQES